MITRDDVHALAMGRREATHVVLFRGRLDVYKVRGKVFGVCSERDGLTFKATEIAYAVLTEDGPGRPAPGFAPGKGHWVNLPLSEVDREDVEGWLETSYRLAAGSLTKKVRSELGLT
ncbi:MmcQ/YjbR family DNA-binding protein [Phenylobacterium sp.]|uniref:MmcQ/YjbR family DNA-binding protein n=1 Tax=Phenylobacterium sp. TaxID=1871053 RepID=UPI002ED9130A